MTITAFVRNFFVAMLSRSMGKYGLAFNIRIEGCGGAFTIGESQKAPLCTVVFDGLLAFCVFANSPRLMTFAKLYIDGHVDCEGEWFAFANIVDKLNDKNAGILDGVIARVPSSSLGVNVLTVGRAYSF